MRTTNIAIGMGAVVAAAGIWFGRSIWLGQHDFVSLNVRNAPLAEVVHLLEGQIREKLSADPKLDAKVTLNVKNMPLTNVLDLLAEQAGARWGKTYAVYGSTSALHSLEGVFHGDATLDAAGWTNLAPHLAKPDSHMPVGADGEPIIIKTPDGNGFSSTSTQFKSPEEMQKFMQDHMKGTAGGGGSFVTTDDVTAGPADGQPGKVTVRRGGPGAGGPGQVQHRVMMRVARGANGTTTTTTTSDGDGSQVSTVRTGPDGTVVQEDAWSQERLVMETPLSPQLGDAIPEKASPETAASTAKKVHGHYATYYALEKPPLGSTLMPAMMRKSFTRNGTNAPMIDMESMGKQNMMGGMGSLTPEQQVQRARQMQEMRNASK